MKQAILNNGIKMPFIGLGVFQLTNPEDAYDAVRSALDLGYRHIDTAMIYENESAVGRAIKDSKVDRDEVFITTKLWPTDIRNNNVKQAFDLSLQKLQVDYIDLYLVHWPVKDLYVSVWTEMEAIYSTGRARAIGVSNYQIFHLNDLLSVCEQPPMVNQIEIHPYFTQKDLLLYCKSNNIQAEAYSPFCRMQNNLFDEAVLWELGAKYNKTPAQIVLRWNVERGVVVVPKSSNKDRQSENLKVFDFSLSTEEVNRISALNVDIREGFDPDDFPF